MRQSDSVRRSSERARSTGSKFTIRRLEALHKALQRTGTWHAPALYATMAAVALRRSRARSVASVDGARKAASPPFIAPCDPVLRQRPPAGRGWLYEIKADGYRVQLHLQDGGVKVYSRTGVDWTAQFASIAAAAKRLAARSAVIDGEAVVYGNTGLPDFQALRRELGPHASKRVRCHAFDLLYLDGFDLRAVSYIERKRLLQDLLAHAPEPFVFVEHLDAPGDRVFDHACKMGLEGVVAKRANAPYRSGRQDSWIKLKCTKSETYPIVAFVEKLGAKLRKIASLYVGRRDGGQLLYAGKVRTGYTEAVAREVRERLDPLIVKTSPLSVPVKKPKATWVKPLVDAEVEYSAITDDGLLRAAVFKGLRDDLALPAIKAPSIRPSKRPHARKPHIGVPRQNILQLLPDAIVPTKAQLAAYWRRVWKRALPHLGRRPLKLVRHVHGTTFYHKGPLPDDIPNAVHRLHIEKREGGEGVRLWVDSLEGFLGLVQIGAVELHPWNATVDDIERADRIVIDLDPGEDVPWQAVADAALAMRELMKAEGLATWSKLTGGKGIHVMAPLADRLPHDETHRFARGLVTALARRDPRLFVLSAQAKRRGRIFLDSLRNGRGTTAIGAYSPRARAGFPIAAPVSWSRIEAGIRPDAFTMDDPFRGRRESGGQGGE
jgi:bifunctional non-homologous end joining protein LigD